MTSLWVPQTAAEKLRSQYTRAYVQQASAHKTMSVWNERLKAIDPRLELVKASEDAKATGLKPGYWHVLRIVPGGLPGVFVHEGPDGEFMEPNSYMLERLERSDLWDDRVRKDREKLSKVLQRAKEKQEAQEAQERVDEIQQRLKARVNPGVRVPRAV